MSVELRYIYPNPALWNLYSCWLSVEGVRFTVERGLFQMSDGMKSCLSRFLPVVLKRWRVVSTLFSLMCALFSLCRTNTLSQAGAGSILWVRWCGRKRDYCHNILYLPNTRNTPCNSAMSSGERSEYTITETNKYGFIFHCLTVPCSFNRGSKVLVFLIVFYVSSYRWVHFSRAVLFYVVLSLE